MNKLLRITRKSINPMNDREAEQAWALRMIAEEEEKGEFLPNGFAGIIPKRRGISPAAAKFVYKTIRGTFKSPRDVVEELDLWVVDEWTHVGFCVLVCLENKKIVDSYIKKGDVKLLDTLTGKVMQIANNTVDAKLIKELLPDVIAVNFNGQGK